MGEPCRHRCPENCETGAREGLAGIHGKRTGVRAGRPGHGFCYCDLEALLRRFLPTAPVQTPPIRPVPTEMEILLERLLSIAPAPAPTPLPRTAITGMETLLQRLLPGTPTQTSRPLPVLAHRDWTTIVCFSCDHDNLTTCHIGTPPGGKR